MTNTDVIPEALDQVGHLCPDLQSQLSVETGVGLIKQQQARTRRKGPGESHPLRLPPGEGIRVAVGIPVETDQVQRPFDSALSDLPTIKAESNVLADGEMRKQRRFLKHHADATPLGWDVGLRPGKDLPVDGDNSIVCTFQPGDDAKHGGLATPTRAEQHQRLALVYLDIDPVEHGRIEGFANTGGLEKCHGKPKDYSMASLILLWWCEKRCRHGPPIVRLPEVNN